MVTTDLKVKLEGEEYSAVSNIITIVNRMKSTCDHLQSWCPSDKLIEFSRRLIDDQKSLNQYIETIKVVDDRATDVHNRLYGKKEK